MYLIENPVLQRELLVNLRMSRGFILMFAYQGLLAALVFLAWPQDQRLDLSTSPAVAQRLVDMFFLGQYVLASLMAPSFAAGTITGEKERRTYEMLLASPLRPSAIVLGKLFASLAYLAVLIFSSLPIIMLCLPLGGVSPNEVFAAYLGLAASVVTFGMIGVACSSYFKRTAASLVVSYLLILPLAILGVIMWRAATSSPGWWTLSIMLSPASAAIACAVLVFRMAKWASAHGDSNQLRSIRISTFAIYFCMFLLLLSTIGFLAVHGMKVRFFLSMTTVIGGAMVVCLALFANTSARLLHPPDVGSEGKEVVDLEQEAERVVGLVIQRDQFPDKLFAPAKRETLLEDNTNPVYDKEIRSEIFSQGTLMLRVVIQVSMLLAIPLMALCLYIWPQYAPWYISYVVVFNMLVGPVFSAGSVTSERERQTLDLLLTTAISPWQILSGKLRAGLRVSSVLTMFLMWPLLLACLMVDSYWNNIPAVLAYFLIVILTCLNTALFALFCSVVFQKTSISLMTTYLAIILLFCAPLAGIFFANFVYQDANTVEFMQTAGFTSPFVTAFAVPLDVDTDLDAAQALRPLQSWWTLAGYFAFTLLMGAALLAIMLWLFRMRWRVAA